MTVEEVAVGASVNVLASGGDAPEGIQVPVGPPSPTEVLCVQPRLERTVIVGVGGGGGGSGSGSVIGVLAPDANMAIDSAGKALFQMATSSNLPIIVSVGVPPTPPMAAPIAIAPLGAAPVARSSASTPFK